MERNNNIRVYKYEIPIADFVDIKMPRGAQILSLQNQNDCPCIWAKVDTSKPEETTRFFIVGTGHPIPVDATTYIGTVLTENDSLVWHVFKGGKKTYEPTELPPLSEEEVDMLALSAKPVVNRAYQKRVGCTLDQARKKVGEFIDAL